MGCRTAIDALRLLARPGASPVASIDEETVCIAETDSCAVDGIQAVTGCTVGKGNLLLRLRGKHAFNFFARETDRAVRIVWTDKTPGLTREERILLYLTAPAEKLYAITLPVCSGPERTTGMPSLVCAACGESMIEPYARLRDNKTYCLDCYTPPLRAVL